MICHRLDWNLAHAPVFLVVASPLHTGMKWAAAIDKDSQAIWGCKYFRTYWTEKHCAGLFEGIRDVRCTSIVGNNGTSVPDQPHQVHYIRCVESIEHIRTRQYFGK